MQAQTSPANQRVIIELRYFRMRNGRQVERTTEYLRRGLLPASERAGIRPVGPRGTPPPCSRRRGPPPASEGAGIRPVGCFNAVIAPDSPFILTLASYPSLAAFDTAREKLAADKEFQ